MKKAEGDVIAKVFQRRFMQQRVQAFDALLPSREIGPCHRDEGVPREVRPKRGQRAFPIKVALARRVFLTLEERDGQLDGQHRAQQVIAECAEVGRSLSSRVHSRQEALLPIIDLMLRRQRHDVVKRGKIRPAEHGHKSLAGGGRVLLP